MKISQALCFDDVLLVPQYSDIRSRNRDVNIENALGKIKLEIPIIATHEVYYLDRSMHEAHDALMCIGQKTYLNE